MSKESPTRGSLDCIAATRRSFYFFYVTAGGVGKLSSPPWTLMCFLRLPVSTSGLRGPSDSFGEVAPPLASCCSGPQPLAAGWIVRTCIAWQLFWLLCDPRLFCLLLVGRTHRLTSRRALTLYLPQQFIVLVQFVLAMCSRVRVAFHWCLLR